MKQIFIIFISLLIFVSCYKEENNELKISKEAPIKNTTETSIKNTTETPPIKNIVESEEKISSNLNEIVSLCDSLCKKDSENYCNTKREVIFNNLNSTIWTCRSLAKENKNFNKCKWFCEKYWEEKKTTKWCNLKDGSKDENCDWQ